MNSKHPNDIHRHLQRAKVCFFTIRIFPNISEYFRIFPNTSEYFRIKFFLIRISGKPSAMQPSCPHVGPQDGRGYVATFDFVPTLGIPKTAGVM